MAEQPPAITFAPRRALVGAAFVMAGIWGLLGADTEDLGWMAILGAVVIGLVGVTAGLIGRWGGGRP